VDARVADVVSRSPNAPLQLGPGAAAIEAAVALALARESIVVISTSPPRIVGGYGIIALIRGADNPWTALYVTRAVEVSWTPVYARPDEQIMDVVDRMRSSGHYNALVMEGDRISGLLTTLDLARFLHSIGALRGKAPVGSAIVGIDPDASLGAAMDLMIGRGLRRLAISGTDFMVSDRSLMRGALDGGLLLRLRDDPVGALSGPVSGYGYMLERPAVLPGGADAHSALDMLLRSSDRVLVTDDRGTVITPWDLSIRYLLSDPRSASATPRPLGHAGESGPAPPSDTAETFILCAIAHKGGVMGMWGPMNGRRGRGWCGGPGYWPGPWYGPGWGLWWPHGWDPYPVAGPYPAPGFPQPDVGYLEAYARQLEDELSRVRSRIDELRRQSRG
jgi:CBS domain-containing protein